MPEKLNYDKSLDPEWVELILVAYHLGISKEELRKFLKTSRRKDQGKSM